VKATKGLKGQKGLKGPAAVKARPAKKARASCQRWALKDEAGELLSYSGNHEVLTYPTRRVARDGASSRQKKCRAVKVLVTVREV
jgi:hypothetical protein